jgi:tetratricopeptide (TPR) repeat protein
MPVVFGLALAAAFAIADGGAVLRRSCDPYDPQVAALAAGTPVDIKFSVNGEFGECYKINVSSDGKTVEGYLPAKALRGLGEYEKLRTGGGRLDSPQAVHKDIEKLQKAAAGESADARLQRAADLMKANQFQEALLLIEQVIKTHPKDANLLAMAGLAAYQGDDPKRAIVYWKDSLALEANPPVENMLHRAEKEVAADGASERLFGARFTFRYNPSEVTSEQARSVVPVLDSEWSRLSQQLGCASGERIAVAVMAPEAYRKATGAAEWSGGVFDGRIRVALIEGNTIGNETRRTIAHEIVHACIAQIGQAPSWLHEGLAQHLSGSAPEATDVNAIKTMAKAGQLPSLKNLSQTWSRLSTQHARVAYATAAVAADLLYQSYGADGVRNLLHNPGMLDQITTDLDRRLRQ